MRSGSGGLRDATDCLAIQLHLASDALVRHTHRVLEVRHDQSCVRRVAAEVRIFGHGGQLCSRTVHRDVAVDSAVWRQEDDVELLDPPLLLHPAHDPDCLVEDLETAFFAPGDTLAPADDEYSIGHENSLSEAQPNAGPYRAPFHDPGDGASNVRHVTRGP